MILILKVRYSWSTKINGAAPGSTKRFTPSSVDRAASSTKVSNVAISGLSKIAAAFAKVSPALFVPMIRHPVGASRIERNALPHIKGIKDAKPGRV
jgi:hypothetical protein